MTFLAATEPCGAAGVSWTVAGDDGAHEVDAFMAHQLLAIPGTPFYVVSSAGEVAEVQPKVEEKPKASAKKKNASEEGSELSQALHTANDDND